MTSVNKIYGTIQGLYTEFQTASAGYAIPNAVVVTDASGAVPASTLPPGVAEGARPIVDLTASRPLTLDDANTFLLYDSTSPATVTVDASGWDVGTEIDLAQWGTGALSIAAGAGVTIKAYSGSTSPFTLLGEAGVAQLKMVRADEWLLSGYV